MPDDARYDQPWSTWPSSCPIAMPRVPRVEQRLVGIPSDGEQAFSGAERIHLVSGGAFQPEEARDGTSHHQRR